MLSDLVLYISIFSSEIKPIWEFFVDISQILLGFAAISGLFFSRRNLNISEKNSMIAFMNATIMKESTKNALEHNKNIIQLEWAKDVRTAFGSYFSNIFTGFLLTENKETENNYQDEMKNILKTVNSCETQIKLLLNPKIDKQYEILKIFQDYSQINQFVWNLNIYGKNENNIRQLEELFLLKFENEEIMHKVKSAKTENIYQYIQALTYLINDLNAQILEKLNEILVIV